MRIVVILVGVSVPIEIEGDCTTLDIKPKIEEKLGHRPDDQRLLFKGRGMEDHRSINYYGIGPDDTVHVVFRLRRTNV